MAFLLRLKINTLLFASVVMLLGHAKLVNAETHNVTANGISMAPLVIEIQPGDAVSWTNLSAHNTSSISGLIPEEAEAWKSTIGRDYQRTFTQQGIYIYRCQPHGNLGMGGAIIVGEATNLEQIKSAKISENMGKIVEEAVKLAESR